MDGGLPFRLNVVAVRTLKLLSEKQLTIEYEEMFGEIDTEAEARKDLQRMDIEGQSWGETR